MSAWAPSVSHRDSFGLTSHLIPNLISSLSIPVHLPKQIQLRAAESPR